MDGVRAAVPPEWRLDAGQSVEGSAGLAWRASGSVEQARASLESALELKPDCQECQVALASLDD